MDGGNARRGWDAVQRIAAALPMPGLEPNARVDLMGGACGLALFFAYLGAAAGAIALLGQACVYGIGGRRAQQILEEAAQRLLDRAFPAGNGSHFPAVWYGDVRPRPARSAWCYGDPGIAAASLLASEATRVARREGLATARMAAIRIELPTVAYFMRTASRPTPLGLFAGCTLGRVGVETALELAPLTDYQRHTRPDIDYLRAVVRGLEASEAIRRENRWYANPTLFRAGLRAMASQEDARLLRDELGALTVAPCPLWAPRCDRARRMSSGWGSAPTPPSFPDWWPAGALHGPPTRLRAWPLVG